MAVDLGDILPDLPSHAALYSESAGRFLVSVAPAEQRRFAEIMQGHPIHLLGEVTAEPDFTLKRQGRTLCSVPLNELKEAWTKRFGNLV